MYEYKVPPSSRVPVVMVHGADLSGKSYETTPDGRMGWEEYFVRKGHAVYLPDQVSRARSGFDPRSSTACIPEPRCRAFADPHRFGDHLTVEPRNWRGAFENCKAFIARINAAKGNAKMLYPPELGIHGNSHMIMQDKNDLEIADLILDWIDRNVGTKVTSF